MIFRVLLQVSVGDPPVLQPIIFTHHDMNSGLHDWYNDSVNLIIILNINTNPFIVTFALLFESTEPIVEQDGQIATILCGQYPSRCNCTS